MELHFVAPELRRFDESAVEVIAACLFADERPPGGVVSLVNWRLAGRLERLVETGFLTGGAGEVMLVPGRPRLGVDKVLLFGLGGRDGFDEARFDAVAERMIAAIADLCVRSAIVELPGRHVDAIAPEVAADRFLAIAARRHGAFDGFFLVERPAEQKRINQRVIEERRRVRQW